ncbi:RsbT co-antagonist protein RsbRA [Heyndrickxia acidiproducens]|uniref:RsbT co-antagonist protein RsbRA n=1 Tax=Heyndrickxia acidiproducens TaxID=1121084 RepID=UPI0003671A85|nr:RsbT co-antagonist protein RsbRA [Heyndrickxia acidiproducens]
MQQYLAEYIPKHKDEILEEWMKAMKSKSDEQVFQFNSGSVFNKTSQDFVEVILARLTKTNHEYEKQLGEFAERIVFFGWPLTFVTTGIQTLGDIVYKKIMTSKAEIEAGKQIEFWKIFRGWTNSVQNEFVNGYATIWEKTISLQKIALRELSAPLIPVFEKISVLPLVGTIDSERARLIMENLLNGVVKNRSEVVLIDITGVPIVDTIVAHHIIQAADAVRLVGAKCMLVGIRPEIAQTIVNLGIDLKHVATTSTLQRGIEEALRLTGRKIVKWEG